MNLRGSSVLLATALLCGCAQEDSEDHKAFALSSNLREVSGLAVAGPNTLYTHDDEYAIIHEIDIDNGHVVRSFALGDPTIEGDFEGIATAPSGEIFLITNDGLIYAFERGEHRKRVAYRAHDSGIGTRCETEGLSRAPDPDHLLLLCKRLRVGEDTPRLEIYRWKLGTEHAEFDPWLDIPLADFLTEDQRAQFAPSGLEWDEGQKKLFVVSGRNHLLVEIDDKGTVVATRSLDPRRHRGAEGIAILPGCRLALADEGTESAKARLAIYPCSWRETLERH